MFTAKIHARVPYVAASVDESPQTTNRSDVSSEVLVGRPVDTAHEEVKVFGVVGRIPDKPPPLPIKRGNAIYPRARAVLAESMEAMDIGRARPAALRRSATSAAMTSPPAKQGQTSEHDDPQQKRRASKDQRVDQRMDQRKVSVAVLGRCARSGSS